MSTPRLLRAVLAASAIGVAPLGVAACGSGDTASGGGATTTTTPVREASWDPTCPEKSSREMSISVINDLKTTITLDVPRASWDCRHWSGTGTPAALDGLSVLPASGSSSPKKVRLELANEDFLDTIKGKFGLRIREGSTTLGNLTLAAMGTGQKRDLAMQIGSKWWCIRAMELRDGAGNPIWVRSRHCETGRPWELQITDTKPS